MAYTKRAPDKTVEIYGGTIKVDYYDQYHRYLVNGEKKMGVTTVTGLIDKSRALIYWATNLTRDSLLNTLQNGLAITEMHVIEAAKLHAQRKQEAADKGTMVHNLAEQWIKSTPKERKEMVMPQDPEVYNGFMAFLGWVRENDVKFLASEKIVYSKEHDYIGTLDSVFTMKAEKHAIRHLGDFKTSSGVYPEMIFQVTAYEEAEKEEEAFLVKAKKMKAKEVLPWGDKYILRFDKKIGDFEPYCIPSENHDVDFDAFKGLLCAKKRLTIIEEEMKP